MAHPSRQAFSLRGESSQETNSDDGNGDVSDAGRAGGRELRLNGGFDGPFAGGSVFGRLSGGNESGGGSSSGLRGVGGGEFDVDTVGLAEADGSGSGLLPVSRLAHAVGAVARETDERGVGAHARVLIRAAIAGAIRKTGIAGILV